ncbi:SigE family RNA polymerase sigma factor [Dactylosporangium maewongense]|uniref:SigE family RNA polymerase sigma factor n=1 Tax=Dactylosporangium maewongense TaxID=634393 RepID=A0ABN1ZL41_9ACTN
MPSGESEEQRQFREYFTARRDVVRRTAYLLCGDWHWADDLTQTAFMRLAVGWRKVRDREALDGFVRTCLVRAYLADVRRVWRRRERSVAEPPDVAGAAGAAEGSPGRIAFAAALRQLPPRQRAVLVCRYYQDLDVAATAAVLGCAQGTVKSQAARGLARLRELLEADGELALTEGLR